MVSLCSLCARHRMWCLIALSGEMSCPLIPRNRISASAIDSGIQDRPMILCMICIKSYNAA